MTKKELVKKLREKANQPDNLHPLINEMSQLMREAADFIEESDWKPVKTPKELPTSDPILVTYDDGFDSYYVDIVYWDMTEWSDDVESVTAYMSLPDPYIKQSAPKEIYASWNLPAHPNWNPGAPYVVYCSNCHYKSNKELPTCPNCNMPMK